LRGEGARVDEVEAPCFALGFGRGRVHEGEEGVVQVGGIAGAASESKVRG
jgi:hypothetical protein